MKLSKAKRDALDWFYRDGSARKWGGAPMQEFGHPTINTLRSLEKHGLARRERRLGEYFAITDAGRAALKDDTDAE
jgi:hypothetical protein